MPYQFNPFTGNLDIAGGDATAVALNLKGTVANQAALPSSGNTVGDVWQTADLKKFYVWDGSAWDDLGTLAGPPGDDGREVELQANATHIQWRYVGDATWTNLVALSVITGPPGPGTDLSYDAASREVRSSTGADATLPLVASSAAGLAPASGGGTINFLRADGTWAAPAGGGGTSFAGYAVDNYIVPTAGALGAGQILANANQIALMAFTVERAITTSELAVRVTTAGAGVDFQLAIYGSASGLHSGTPIISTNDLSGGTAGLVQATVTATTFQPGVLYWQAVNTSGTLTFLSVAANNSYHSSIIGSPTLSEALASAGTTFHCRIITSQTFGTWPDLTGVSSVVPNSSQRRVPVFAFLISALP